MEDINKLCKGCMQYTAHNGVCSACGFNENEYKSLPHHLKPGTVLAGKYFLGRKIGEGGFGITYMGIDLNLKMRVAIKEYFPAGCVTRNTEVSDTITVFDGEQLRMFEHGRSKFIEEARTIAQFNDSEGIVSVKDFFLENGTAYIVMEYLDGENLKEFLTRNGGKINVDDALNMVKSLLSSLSQLHKKGLVHRDISPDNIMITRNGRVKLIDFGAARDVNGNKSLSIQLKPGYAPEEQYRTHGKQGPWTDVYALCATIYRMITGIVPEESNERLIEDRLKAPSSLGINIRPEIENVLMSGLAVRYNERIQNIETLYDAFYKGFASMNVTAVENKSFAAQSSGKDKWSAITVALSVSALVIVIIVAFLLVHMFVFEGKKEDNTAEQQYTAVPATASPTSAPMATPLPPRNDLYNPGYTYKRMDKIHSSYLVDDAKYLELKNAILDFDEKCVNYMNNGDTAVFQYLRAGTTAYEQQTDYKKNHSTIYEIMNYVDVINARFDGESYYVWVTEDMTVTEKGVTKNTVDHWVYKLAESDRGYIITDYTKDPAF